MAKTVLSQTKKVKYSVRPDGTQEYTGKSRTRVSRETEDGPKGVFAKVAKWVKEVVCTLIVAWLKSKFNF